MTTMHNVILGICIKGKTFCEIKLNRHQIYVLGHSRLPHHECDVSINRSHLAEFFQRSHRPIRHLAQELLLLTAESS